jgi:cobalt-zinc-cadmium efflux system outer membrane protein
MSRFLFITSLLLATISLRAESFTLDSAVAYALKHNPSLVAAKWSIEQARGRLLQSGRLSNPELEASHQHLDNGQEFSVGIGLVQKFPLTDRLRLEKSVSQAELAAAEAEVATAAWQLTTEIRTAGVKILSLQNNRALKQKLISTNNELIQKSRDLAQRAEGSVIETAQLELEAQQLALALLQLDAEEAQGLGELRPLLGIKSTEPLTLTGSLPELPPALPSAIDLEARPDLQAAQARIEAAQQGAELAKANRWEDASAGLFTQFQRSEDAPEGLENEGIIGLQFSLPIPWWNKNEGKIHEAEATVSRTKSEAEALRMKLRTEAAAALQEMKAAQRIIAETKNSLLPKAQAIENQLNQFYREAQPGAQLSDVLRAREKRLTLEQASIDALRTYHLARIRYEAATKK